MAGARENRKPWIRAVEAVLAIFLLLAIAELILIHQRPHTAPPEVRLIEKTVETVVVKLPPGASTNSAVLHTSQPMSSKPRPQEIVTIQRTSPPLLAFENIRRALGLLGPAQPDVVMAYRRNESQREIPFTQPGQTNRVTEMMVTNVTQESAVVSATTANKPDSGDRPKTPTGDPFRISLPR